jgi:hypothetical protein
MCMFNSVMDSPLQVTFAVSNYPYAITFSDTTNSHYSLLGSDSLLFPCCDETVGATVRSTYHSNYPSDLALHYNVHIL